MLASSLLLDLICNRLARTADMLRSVDRSVFVTASYHLVRYFEDQFHLFSFVCTAGVIWVGAEPSSAVTSSQHRRRGIVRDFRSDGDTQILQLNQPVLWCAASESINGVHMAREHFSVMVVRLRASLGRGAAENQCDQSCGKQHAVFNLGHDRAVLESDEYRLQ